MLKKIDLFAENDFKNRGPSSYLAHESPYMKVINFNFKAGQELPVHSHQIDGQLTIAVLEGEGEFLGEGDAAMPASPGDLLVSDISEPHGIRAKSDMRVVVTIAPPI